MTNKRLSHSRKEPASKNAGSAKRMNPSALKKTQGGITVTKKTDAASANLVLKS